MHRHWTVISTLLCNLPIRFKYQNDCKLIYYLKNYNSFNSFNTINLFFSSELVFSSELELVSVANYVLKSLAWM